MHSKINRDRMGVLSLALALLIGAQVVGIASDARAEKVTTAAKADADAQVATLEAQCAATSAARAQRQSQKSLYERLGKEDGIHAFTEEIVRLHLQNDEIKHLLNGVDADKLANRVALFVISGTGGPSVYEGPSLTDSHRRLNLTNADFMSAGSDIIQAMKNLKYGQDEIDEMVCTLVALRPMVVLSGDQAK